MGNQQPTTSQPQSDPTDQFLSARSTAVSFLSSAIEPTDEFADAQKRKEKDIYVRANFPVGDNERVIQNYWCTCVWEKDTTVSFNKGKLYFTQNYILYEEATVKLAVPLIEVKQISEEKHIFSWIAVETVVKKYYFSRFIGKKHYYEALFIATYLWRNPPSYMPAPEDPKTSPTIDSPTSKKKATRKYTWLADDEEEDEEEADEVENPHHMQEGPSSFSQDTKRKNGGSTNPFDVSTGSNQTQLTVKVNVEASKRGLALLQETEAMGADTLNELGRQAEQIDRIELAVENIHAQMDKAEVLLRGIESLPAYIGNTFRKQKEPTNKKAPPDRTVVVKTGEAPPIQIEILCKKQDCSLQLAILSLEQNGFKCIDPVTDALLDRNPHFSYQYSEVAEVVIRTRSEHLDIRFSPPKTYKDRFRLMSSYNQIIVNEFYFRTNGKVKVIFEAGAEVFAYGYAKISSQAPIPRKAVQTGFFVRGNNPGFKTSALMGDDVSQEVKDQLDQVDENIEQMSKLLGRVYDINVTIGQEIDRQNEQLEHVSNRVDLAQERIENSNLKMNKIIH